jgi:multisubunit Na+/H+ antiporter MnhC subunit
VTANNNQNSNLYTEYEYGLYGVSVVTTYIVVGMAILAVLASLLFRAGKIIVF